MWFLSECHMIDGLYGFSKRLAFQPVDLAMFEGNKRMLGEGREELILVSVGTIDHGTVFWHGPFALGIWAAHSWHVNRERLWNWDEGSVVLLPSLVELSLYFGIIESDTRVLDWSTKILFVLWGSWEYHASRSDRRRVRNATLGVYDAVCIGKKMSLWP